MAYVIGELGRGGAEYQLHELLRCVDRRLIEPSVVALAAGGWWAEPIRRLGVPLVELPRRHSGDVARLVRLRRALAAIRPHVLHTILWSANVYGRLAAMGLGIPCVVAAERNVIDRATWQVRLERALDRITDAYLVNCRAIAEQLVARQRIARTKIEVIPNGIDLARLPPFALDRRAARAALGFDPDRRLVAQVGRLTAQKDYPTFLEAAAGIAASAPDIDFLLVGEGEERARLEALVTRRGLSTRVRFTGLRDDVPALLGAVDVMALTSLYEGFPNVVVEAMAAGAVVVATDDGGTRELVTPEETGLLVPAREPAAVATAVSRVFADAALARRLATAARRRVENELTVGAMASRTIATYQRLLGAGSVTLAPVAAA